MNDSAISSLLTPELLPSIIGVIDLQRGIAVHGIAGNRNDYRAVDFCDGSPIELARYYRGLGLARLYVADLDAILGHDVQVTRLDETIAAFGGDEVILDSGWTGNGHADSIASLASRYAGLRFIAATETASSIDAIGQMAQTLSPDRILLGLDYRDGNAVDQTTETSNWLDEADRCHVNGVLVLDVAAVGTASGVVTQTICQRIADQHPRFRIYSGGGIRSATDVKQLIDAGCHGCLIATALHPRN